MTDVFLFLATHFGENPTLVGYTLGACAGLSLVVGVVTFLRGLDLLQMAVDDMVLRHPPYMGCVDGYKWPHRGVEAPGTYWGDELDRYPL